MIVVRRGSLLSRIAALAVLFGGMALLYLGIAVPVMDGYREVRASIEDARHLIRRYEARRQDVDALKEELAQLRADGTSAAAFIRAQNASLAAADLQGRLGRLVQSLKGKLTSAQPIPPTKTELFQRVTIRAQMTLSTEGMRQVIQRIESGRPYLFVDNVVIRRSTRNRVVRRSGRGEAAQVADLLDVRFDVYGFMWGKGVK